MFVSGIRLLNSAALQWAPRIKWHDPNPPMALETMSRLHVFEAVGQQQPNVYRVILHETTPAGINSAGVTWVAALAGSGAARTRMTEGTGAGQITTAEKAQVESGNVVEGEFYFQDNPTDNPTQRNAALDAHATRYLAELEADISVRLKWFGASRP